EPAEPAPAVPAVASGPRDAEERDLEAAYDPDYRSFDDDSDPWGDRNSNSSATAEPASTEQTSDQPAPAAPEPQRSSGPSFSPDTARSNTTGPVALAFQEAPVPASTGTRYGESVVREVLGAKFIEERPLPQGGE